MPPPDAVIVIVLPEAEVVAPPAPRMLRTPLDGLAEPESPSTTSVSTMPAPLTVMLGFE